jgi:hypothetical protein
MSISRKITCIAKSDKYKPYERIKSIGGAWGKVTQLNAIKQIESKKYHYHVLLNGFDVKVIVAIHSGKKYLKTANDGLNPNDLLSLPVCI